MSPTGHERQDTSREPESCDPVAHPVTFAAAQRLHPLALASRVGDVWRWLDETAPDGDVAPGDPARPGRLARELEHLASVRALHDHLAGITAYRIHVAVISGATAEQVSRAAGLPIEEVAAIWTAWSHAQRRLEADLPDLPRHTAAYDYVAEALAAGGPATAAPASGEPDRRQEGHQ